MLNPSTKIIPLERPQIHELPVLSKGNLTVVSLYPHTNSLTVQSVHVGQCPCSLSVVQPEQTS